MRLCASGEREEAALPEQRGTRPGRCAHVMMRLMYDLGAAAGRATPTGERPEPCRRHVVDVPRASAVASDRLCGGRPDRGGDEARMREDSEILLNTLPDAASP